MELLKTKLSYTQGLLKLNFVVTNNRKVIFATKAVLKLPVIIICYNLME
jgi:hypothetical protein